MYIYTSREFERKASSNEFEQFNLKEKVEKWRSTLTERDVRIAFKAFVPYYWKHRQGKLRIIARFITIDGERVFCILNVFWRKAQEYDKNFLLNPDAYGKKQLDPLARDDEVQAWLIEERKNKRTRPEVLPVLPEEYLSWVSLPGWTTKGSINEEAVYEGLNWIRSFKANKNIQDFWRTIHSMVINVLENTMAAANVREVIPGLFYYWTSDGSGFGIFFKNVNVIDAQENERRILFLMDVCEHSVKDVHFEELRHLLENLRFSSETLVRLDDLARYTQRAYPSYIVYDEGTWLKIEKEDEANLALSTEEENLLHLVSVPTDKINDSLPIFINGRAGSGKSTMLFYLFADYCDRKLKKQLSGRPIYLTYNERLLDVAKKGVKKLLGNHHRFVEDSVTSNQNELVESFFYPFHSFMLSLLPEDQKSAFEPAKRVSFHVFRRLYTNDVGDRLDASAGFKAGLAQKISPEICWHIIRTFIKGYVAGDYMEPEEYEEIPRRERSVKQETFKQVYEEVWEKWYQSLRQEHGLWDDQDLIRHIIENKLYSPEFTAIFCDEAQDFTRLELQLVMHLSLFSRYTFGHQPIASLPFAFAGDPAQTLNPTGFRWSGLQAAVYEEIIERLDPEHQYIGINFKELSFNYRSTPSIVKFTNTIQLWRQVLFELNDLGPQTSWQYMAVVSSPKKFILDLNIELTQLKEFALNTIIIVPCEEGQEQDFVENDPVLKEITDGSIKNILSAVSAKGLEFKKVILYKFGEACPVAAWQLVDSPNKESDDRLIEYEYYFNKLYVAASRAMEYLFVVDSEIGDERLWQSANQIDWLKQMRDGKAWQNQIASVVTGIASDLKETGENDPLSIADEFKNKGLSSQDADLLYRASDWYLSINRTKEAHKCEAYALYYDGKYEKAGHAFLRLNMLDDAWRSFWEGSSWPMLQQMLPRITSPRPPHEVNIVHFMNCAYTDRAEGLKNFSGFIEDYIGKSGNFSGKQWRQALERYRSWLSNPATLRIPATDLIQAAQNLENMRLGDGNMLLTAATCYFEAGNFVRAVSCWENSKDSAVVQSDNYYIAKSEVVGLPQGLEWLSKLGDGNKRIVKLWEDMYQNTVATNDPLWLRYIGAIYAANKFKYAEALSIYTKLKDKTEVLEILRKAADTKNLTFEMLVEVCDFFAEQENWLEMLQISTKYLQKSVTDKQKQTEFRCRVALRLAKSDFDLENENQEAKKPYEDFVQLLQQSEWNLFLKPQVIGTLLERIGFHLNALEFYEKYYNLPDNNLREFSRQRWLVVKQRQISYMRRNQRDKAALAERERELNAKAASWNVSLANLNLHLEQFFNLDGFSVQNQSTTTQPPVKLKSGKNTLGHLDIIVNPSKLRINDNRNMDEETLEAKWQLFDANKFKVFGREDCVIHELSDGLSYEVPSADYSFTVIKLSNKMVFMLTVSNEARRFFEF
jgi:hypothetical protein